MQPSEEIKARIDIVDLIREYINLQPAGVNFRARCPFHQEKSPSFIVSPDKQIYHCFGCGRGGDIFSFIQEMEGVNFVEALRILAPKAGVSLKRQDPKLSSERNRIMDIMDISRKFYHKTFLESPFAKKAREYLLERGLKEETMEEWQIGFSLDSWDSILNLLKSQGFKEIEIFIRSCAFVKQQLPGAEFFVIGPINHDTDYYNSCLVLKEKLGLHELAFTGEVDLSGYLDQLDVVVLTSKSEGQPFVLLESMAAGIPVVATDVGGCCELVNGFDDGMGSAGEICSVGDVAGISAAIFKICANSKLWYQYSQTGKKRVEAFYSKKRFLESYKSLYSKHLGKATG